jgi:hypothetical protein
MIYFPIFQPAGPLIIQQARQSTDLANVFLMGADGLFSPDVPKGAGDFVETNCSGLVTGAEYARSSPSTRPSSARPRSASSTRMPTMPTT